MADTVLTELKIHEFDSVEQMSQYESEIGENDMVYTPDEIHEYVKRDAETGVTMVLGDADNLGARLSLISRKSAYTDKFDGEFNLTAANDETGNTLCGKPDGTLTWSGDPIEVIVESQSPTADNGYTWYRKYKSGWVEMGGTLSGRSIAFPVAFIAIPTLVLSIESASDTAIYVNVYNNLTVTGFAGWRRGVNAGWLGEKQDMNGCWTAQGVAA